MSKRYPIFLSIVIPVRKDDSLTIDEIAKTSEKIAPLVEDFELIVVDNGSDLENHKIYQSLIGPDGLANIRIYHLLQQAEMDVAVWAGVENSLGDYILVYDPVSENLSKLEDGLDLIYAG